MKIKFSRNTFIFRERFFDKPNEKNYSRKFSRNKAFDKSSEKLFAKLDISPKFFSD